MPPTDEHALAPAIVVEDAPGSQPRGGVESRRAERFPVAGLRCGLGRLTDLSKLGMRLEAPLPWRVGRTRIVTIRGKKSRMKVKARCVWRRREGLFRWALGVQFDDHNRWRLSDVYDLAQAHRSDLAPPDSPPESRAPAQAA